MKHKPPPLSRALLVLVAALKMLPTSVTGAEMFDGRTPDFSIGGFARVSLLVGGISADRDQPADSELWIPDIPVDSRPASDRTRMNIHATDSRIWARAVQSTGVGELEVLVEGDLDNQADGHEPRLRHAYVMLGPLLAGKTWTTFTNTSALADLDSGIAPGNVVTRSRVLRWRQELNPQTTVTVAVEESLNRLHFAGTDNIVSAGDRRPPDLVLRVDRAGNWGNLSLSMLAREVTTTNAAFPGARTDRQTGSAFSLAGRIQTGALDNLRLMFNYGEALARHATLATYADATITADGELHLSPIYSALTAWQHFWSPRWRSTFAYSYSRTDPHPATNETLTRSAQTAQTNLIWTPDSRFSIGLEYLYGRRSLIDGRDGELQRLQVTTRLNF